MPLSEETLKNKENIWKHFSDTELPTASHAEMVVNLLTQALTVAQADNSSAIRESDWYNLYVEMGSVWHGFPSLDPDWLGWETVESLDPETKIAIEKGLKALEDRLPCELRNPWGGNVIAIKPTSYTAGSCRSDVELLKSVNRLPKRESFEQGRAAAYRLIEYALELTSCTGEGEAQNWRDKPTILPTICEQVGKFIGHALFQAHFSKASGLCLDTLIKNKWDELAEKLPAINTSQSMYRT